MELMQVNGAGLEVQRLAAAAGRRLSPIIFLHEGLGSVAMWRDWTGQVCAATVIEAPGVLNGNRLALAHRIYDNYRAETRGALDASAETATSLWKRGQAPSEAELNQAVATMRQQHWSLGGASFSLSTRAEARTHKSSPTACYISSTWQGRRAS